MSLSLVMTYFEEKDFGREENKKLSIKWNFARLYCLESIQLMLHRLNGQAERFLADAMVRSSLMSAMKYFSHHREFSESPFIIPDFHTSKGWTVWWSSPWSYNVSVHCCVVPHDWLMIMTARMFIIINGLTQTSPRLIPWQAGTSQSPMPRLSHICLLATA